MKHRIKILSLFVFCSSVFASYSFISYSQQNGSNLLSKSIGKSVDKNYNEFIGDIIKRVKKDYVEEKTDAELSEAAADGILSSLDPHSSYMNEEGLREIQVQTKGEFGGLGIEITSEFSVIKVITAIDGTPAEKVGIKSGDYITKVDGQSIVGLKIEDVVKKLRGKPGTKVNVTVIRKGEKVPLDFLIERQIIKIKAVKARQESDIGYIKINTFSEQTTSELVSELKKFTLQAKKGKFRGLVIDLRNNPGGLLDQAVKVSDIFLDKGATIVSISGRDKSNTVYYKDDVDQTLVPGLPIAVLINEGSASASEIVAGALQDNKRAIILGNKSFGKGSVQSIIPLGTGKGALKMTTALYYTPSGKSIQAHGIEPDILVTEAKLEKTDKKNSVGSESELNGHLENKLLSSLEENKDSQLKDENLELYNRDYQLARAVDLLRGISLYNSIAK